MFHKIRKKIEILSFERVVNTCYWPQQYYRFAISQVKLQAVRCKKHYVFKLFRRIHAFVQSS